MDIRKFKNRDPEQENAWDAWLGKMSVTDEDSLTPTKPEPSAVYAATNKAHQSKIDGFRRHEDMPKSSFATQKSSPKNDTSTVSIQIHMPDWHLPAIRIPWRTVRPWLIGLIGLILLLGGSKLLVDRLHHEKPVTTMPVSVQAVVALGYKPLVPSARPEGEPQPTAPKFDEKRKLYTFNDTFKSVNVTVDQQALPEKFKSQKEIDTLTESIQATKTFTTTVGTVHIFTDQPSGSQRLILNNSKMLMFIQSTKTLSNADWVAYIQELQ